MNLDKSLPLKERQRLAAKRTHQTRQKATESKIRAACRSLQGQGKKLSQIALAKATGVARQTVAKYQYILNEIHQKHLKATNVVPLEAVSGQVQDVNYGTYQISDLASGCNQEDQYVCFPPLRLFNSGVDPP
jgi:hypothetical protein